MKRCLLILVSFCLIQSAYSTPEMDAEAQYYKAHERYYTQKDASGSEQILTNVLKNAPTHKFSNYARLLLASIYVDTKRLDEAQSLLEEAKTFHYAK